MKFFNKEISGPFTIPSGIITTNPSTMKRVADDIRQIGILSSKSIGEEPREGNREPIVHCQYPGRPGTFINAVGLRNPGADRAAEEFSGLELPEDRFLLASVFGATVDEMRYVVERLDPYVDGFELNYSCPHSHRHGTAIGHNPESVDRFTRAVRKKTDKPILAKLSPNLELEKIKEIALAAMRAGADGITAINTIGPEIYRIDGHPVLTSPIGGSLSGEKIRNRGIEVAKAIRDAIGSEYPMIVMGGISTARDIEECVEVGGEIGYNLFIGIGTALAGMSTKNMVKYFAVLESDIENGTNEAEKYLAFNKSGHKKFSVKESIKFADDLYMLTLDKGFEIEPGQFAFVWIPGVGEKPYSLIEKDPVRIVVQRRGQFSTALTELDKGRILYLRGPCGNPVEFDGVKDAVLVGGGTGIAALYLIAKGLRERGVVPKTFFGAKDSAHLFCSDEFLKDSSLYLTTEDGSAGQKGLVTKYFRDKIGELYSDDTVFFNCGPIPMVREAEAIESLYTQAGRIFSSEEVLTRCGYGLCGECARDDGLRRCVDGYFMNPI